MLAENQDRGQSAAKADERKTWSAPLVIGTLRFSETRLGSISTYPEGAPTPFGGTGSGS